MNWTNRIRTTGHGGAGLMAAAMGSPSPERAVRRQVRASVLDDALTLLDEKLKDDPYFNPWEYAYASHSRTMYEAVMAELREESDNEHREGSSEMMFARALRRNHQKEVKKLVEESRPPRLPRVLP